jgi:hypothetical protein
LTPDHLHRGRSRPACAKRSPTADRFLLSHSETLTREKLPLLKISLPAVAAASSVTA